MQHDQELKDLNMIATTIVGIRICGIRAVAVGFMGIMLYRGADLWRYLNSPAFWNNGYYVLIYTFMAIFLVCAISTINILTDELDDILRQRIQSKQQSKQHKQQQEQHQQQQQ